MLLDIKSSIYNFFSKKEEHYQTNKIDVLLKELKNNLLDSDISIDFVNQLIKKIKNKSEVCNTDLNGLKKKIFTLFYLEIYSLLGNVFKGLVLEENKMNVIMVCGTSGVGKTSFCVKLAAKLKQQKPNLKIAVCSIDNKRPAAQEQLKKSAKQESVDFIARPEELKSSPLSQQAFYLHQLAYRARYSVLIIDTPGLSPINMFEIKKLCSVEDKLNPCETLLLVDSTTGQVATNTSAKFNQFFNITGVVLTKVEGNSGIGTAINVKTVIDRPIKYLSIGEKNSDIEEFHPNRITKRILNIKDSAGLTEYMSNFKESLEDIKSTFDFDDLYRRLFAIKNNYNINYILSFLPKKINKNNEKNKILTKEMSIILSMTKKERKDPYLIDINRKQRIANGSGNSCIDVDGVINRLLKTRKTLSA